MDLHSQVYLGCMSAMVLLVLIFSTFKFSGTSIVGNVSHGVSIFDMGIWGNLVFLGGVAGIGIFIWEKIASRKDAWIPLAVAGTAGLAVLCFLVIWSRTRGAGGNFSVEGAKYSAGLTLLGFYLPLLCAIGATAVATMRILNAKS